MSKMRVGLVGCGNIATDLCIAIASGEFAAEVVALTDLDAQRAEVLRATYRLNAVVCEVEENARRSDFLVECAAQSAVASVLTAAIAHGRPCLIMSVGGLLAEAGLAERAQAGGVTVRVPSGALSGLDGVRAAREAGLDRVTLTTRKPPRGLAGAPYLVEHAVDVAALTEPTVVFEGSAREACRAFPSNVNVAAALSLAGLGPDRTRVRIVADPAASANVHEVVAEGAFGRLTAVTENKPSPRNARSSYLASLSAVAELRAAAEAFAARGTKAKGGE